jgi:hypothetical protein
MIYNPKDNGKFKTEPNYSIGKGQRKPEGRALY